MTTLAHEINQPLNALSMYLFTAGRAIEQGQAEQARMTLSKAEGLINRIDAIIRSCASLPAAQNWKRRCIRSICVRRLPWRGNCWRCVISLSRGRW